MCTAAAYKTKDFYFGRTLDLDFSYEEKVIVTPRNYPFAYRKMGTQASHYAIIGMAVEMEGYPLYFDGANEKGLGMAGLNFPGNACYYKERADRDNVTPFEFIPWILGQCATVEEARPLLERLNLLDLSFGPQVPLSPLHWILADKNQAITVEAVAEGLRIYENPVGILTNNPPFDYQMFHLNHFMKLSPEEPENQFSKKVHLEPYCRGMGAQGMPGDLSSDSRFVRAAFTKLNAVSGDSEEESVSQFFHILGAVEQQRGCVKVGGDNCEITVYTSCCNADKGVYYYTTYENHQISAVDMRREDLDGHDLAVYPLIRQQQIRFQN